MSEVGLELKRKKYRINLYGETIDLAVPTVGQYEEYLKSLKDPNVDHYGVMKNLLIQLGLSEDKLLQLDQDDFVSLIGYVGNPKKK